MSVVEIHRPKQKDRIDVLDHGFVRLVDHMGSDLSIVRAARTSFDADWRAGEDAGSDKRLIHYLWRNAHSTPFEAVEFQFEVSAPIFVLRQWMRHRTWSFNELSARYRELPVRFYVPAVDTIGEQSKDNKQARVQVPLSAERTGTLLRAVQHMERAAEDAFSLYEALLHLGMPRELARTVLPLSTYSHMFAKVDLRNLFGFLELRRHDHAQYEIRVYAEAILQLIRPIVPVAVGAWEAGQ